MSENQIWLEQDTESCQFCNSSIKAAGQVPPPGHTEVIQLHLSDSTASCWSYKHIFFKKMCQCMILFVFLCIKQRVWGPQDHWNRTWVCLTLLLFSKQLRYLYFHTTKIKAFRTAEREFNYFFKSMCCTVSLKSIVNYSNAGMFHVVLLGF